MQSKEKQIFISVYLSGRGFTPAGVITINEDAGYSVFSYFTDYMQDNLPPLNPATLNWRENQQRHFITNLQQSKHMLDKTFWEMLPNQNDWGNQVLMSRFPEYTHMNNAQRLYFLGNRIMGGLKTNIDGDGGEENIQSLDYLDKVRDESIAFYLKQIDSIRFPGAIKSLSSYGGVRPKCMYEENGEFWIVKFNCPDDPYDMAVAEHIAIEMSQDMGLKTAESKIVTLASGENVFFSKRFDRHHEQRYHSLSLFSLYPFQDKIKKNDSVFGNPGSFVQSLIKRYSDFENMDTVNIVTKMLLDIGLNNTDNHLRNLRIILNDNNKWELAPIYDVTFNPYSQNHIYNPAGMKLNDLYLENPHLPLAMSQELGVSIEIVHEQVLKVKSVLNNWEAYCDKYNVKAEDKDKIAQAVHLGLYRKEYESKAGLDTTPVLTNYPKLKPKNV